MSQHRLTKYIGQRVGGGIVVGARSPEPGIVEFDVLIDGERETHRIDTRSAE